MDDATMQARFERALAEGGNLYTLADVAEACERGEMQWWQNDAACVVTTLSVYPRGKVLHVVLGAGEIPALADLQPKLAAFAAEHGCKFVSTAGRLGWERVLPKHGWKPAGVVYALPLGEG